MNSYMLSCAFIGILATLAMTLFLRTLKYLNLSHVDMVKAIGSWFTGKEENALLPGLLTHFSAGILFCFLYIYVFGILPNPGTDIFIYSILGGGMGFVHGIVVALALVVLVREHHPLAKFRKAGMGVAIGHFIAHIIYGIVVGTLYIWILNAKPMISQ